MLEFYSSYNQNSLLFSIKRRRPSPYASRFTTNHNCIWENLHQYGASPNNSCFALFSCGDCEAIEQICLAFPKKHSAKLIFLFYY